MHHTSHSAPQHPSDRVPDRAPAGRLHRSCPADAPCGFGDERGATAVEYAILASLIAAVIAGVVGVLGLNVLGLFDTVVGVF